MVAVSSAADEDSLRRSERRSGVDNLPAKNLYISVTGWIISVALARYYHSEVWLAYIATDLILVGFSVTMELSTQEESPSA